MLTDIIGILIGFVNGTFTLLYIIIFASIVLSLVGASPHNPIVEIIYQISEPMLRPLRRFTYRIPPPQLDWSPIVLYLLLQIVQVVIVRSLQYLAMLGA